MNETLAINGGRPVKEEPLPSAYPEASVYGEEEKEAVLEVLDHKSPYRYYGSDRLKKVKEYENAFSRKIGSIGVTSGTASLVVALKAAGIGPGDKVIVPACTFLATPGAVVTAGGVPVFADADDSMSMDPDSIEKLVDKNTRAMLPVHLLGNPCDLEKIMKTAWKYGLTVIEDVAQSCGCKFKGRYCGSFGI